MIELQVQDVVAEALAGHGATTLSGLVGGTTCNLAHVLVSQHGADYLAARHENVAVAMAIGHAQSTGDIGFTAISQGPGITNAMTALGEAAKGRTPVVAFLGTWGRSTIQHNQLADHAALAAALGVGYWEVRSPETAVEDVNRAVAIARQAPGPVILAAPSDILMAPASHSPTAFEVPNPPPASPTPQAIHQAVEAIAGAERPLLLVGRGTLGVVRERLELLAQRLGALCATTAVAKGMFAGSPWDLGSCGGFAHDTAIRFLQQADAVVAIGASLNQWTLRQGTLPAAGAAIVHVDSDQAAIGRWKPVTAAVVGDASLAVEALIDAIEPESRWRTDDVAAALAAYEPATSFTDTTGGGTIDPRRLVVELDAMLPENRRATIDSGHFMGFPATYFGVSRAGDFVFPQAFQAMGTALGTAIGMARAQSDRITVSFQGDGGTLMVMGDLETVARSGLPILIVVFNDAAYGAELHYMRFLGMQGELSRFDSVDLAAAAAGLGMAAVTVRDGDELAAVTEWSRSPSGPMLVDAKVDPDVQATYYSEAFMLAAGLPTPRDL